MLKTCTQLVLLSFALASVSLFAGGSRPPVVVPTPPPSPPSPPGAPEPFPPPERETDPHVEGFSLYNDVQNADLAPFASLKDGDTVDLSKLNSAEGLNIRAKVNQEVQSVEFRFSGEPTRTENSAPFTVFEEDGVGPDRLLGGRFVIQATPFSERRNQGREGLTQTMTLNFVGEVQDDTPAPSPPPTPPEDYDPRRDPYYDGYRYRPGQGFTLKKHRLPPKPSCVREVTETITVNGSFDGKGCLYIFRGRAEGKSYREICYAPKEISEKMPPMFKLNPGASIKNVVIECALDGIHTTRDNVIDNVFMRDVEEDAVTARENVVIKNSQFWFCNDKCIQMNSANNVTIQNNRFIYAQTPVLANWGRNVVVENNYFYDNNRAIRARQSQSRIRAENNSQEGGNCHLAAEDNGRVEDFGPGKVTGVRRLHCEDRGGKVIRR